MHESSEDVLVVAPGGEGGVASAVRAVLPELTGARWARIGRTPGDPIGARAFLDARAAARSARVVHVHPSLRWRAFPRDLAVAAGHRRVVHLHGWDEGRLAAVERSARLGRWLRTVLRGAIVASASETLAARLRGLGVETETVPNAVLLSSLPVRRDPVPDEVLYLGRLVAGKGVEVLVDAARGADFRVTVAGEGPLRAELERRAPPNARFVGWVSAEVRSELLARASVLALPSEAEASPVAVVEALASGVPVVARPVGDVPHLVDGAGVLLSSWDPRAWRDTLTRVLDRPPEMTEARDRIRAMVAPEAVAGRWRELHRRARGLGTRG